MSQYDTDYIIAQVKRRGSLPTSQNLFTDAKLVLMIDDELKTRIVPFLMSFHDNWFVTHTTYSGDSSTTTFAIPSDAVGQKLKDVTIFVGTDIKYGNVPLLEYRNLQYANYGYYIEGTNIIFYPATKTPSTGDTINLSYYKRVSNIVATSEARAISAIATADVDSATTLPATFVTNAEVQIVSKSSPFNIVWTGTISSVTGNTVTLSSSPTSAVVGDWLCLAGETVFPQIPIECMPLLCQAVVIRCMESMNDREGMQNAASNYQQIEYSAKTTLSPRVDSRPGVIFPDRVLLRGL